MPIERKTTKIKHTSGGLLVVGVTVEYEVVGCKDVLIEASVCYTDPAQRREKKIEVSCTKFIKNSLCERPINLICPESVESQIDNLPDSSGASMD